jgi:hypothetical protein
LFKEAVTFFEHLNEQLKNGSYDEKHEALVMMNDLHKEMQTQTQRICQQTGLTEQQLTAYADNPDNFTPEQWRSLEETKQKMAKASALTQPPSPLSRKGATPAKPKGSLARKKPKRSDWLRS